MDSFQAIHGTIKATEGPPNLGSNLPLSTKLTNSNCISSNNKDGGNDSGHDNREKKSFSPLKKINSEYKKTSDPGYTCAECNNLFTSREVFVAHMKREHGKVSHQLVYNRLKTKNY